MTIHGDARPLFERGADRMTRALNCFDAVICVREGDHQFLRERGVTTAVFEIPAFIFPVFRTGEAGLSDKILNFMTCHKFVMGANASAIESYRDCDLYGIDMCLRLTAGLKENMPDLRPGFIFCLSRMNDPVRFREYQTFIKKWNLQNDFLFVTGQTDLHAILQKIHLFIRPTNTDGYSVSLAEALYLRVPSLASDVVPRPEGTILFKTRDNDDLLSQTLAVIKNYEECRTRVLSLKFDDNARRLFEVYQELLG